MREHECTITLDDDDCALLQLGALCAQTPRGKLEVCIRETVDEITCEQTEDTVIVAMSPTAYAVLLHMSFAVVEVSGKKIWLRMDENRIAEREGLVA